MLYLSQTYPENNTCQNLALTSRKCTADLNKEKVSDVKVISARITLELEWSFSPMVWNTTVTTYQNAFDDTDDRGRSLKEISQYAFNRHVVTTGSLIRKAFCQSPISSPSLSATSDDENPRIALQLD